MKIDLYTRCWKEGYVAGDWVIVTDIDEHLYQTNRSTITIDYSRK